MPAATHTHTCTDQFGASLPQIARLISSEGPSLAALKRFLDPTFATAFEAISRAGKGDQFIDDLITSPGLKNAAESLTEGQVRAWGAMVLSPALRVNISKLEALSEQISKHAAKLDDFKVKFANATETGKQSLLNKVDVFFGFKPSKFSEDIVAIPKGSRQDPNTYLTTSYVSEHLNKFNGGVTKIVTQAPTGTVGPPGGTFILPKSYADDLISQSNGSVSKLEELLGLDAGYLGRSPVRVDVNAPSGLRMPSGNELGANEFWIPGGKTSGGVLEATVDQIQPGTYTVTSVF